MTRIHNNEVKNIAKCNLLHNIINAPKRAKSLNSHYSTILNGCMNTRKSKARFNNFHILLDSGCSSTILMGRLAGKTSVKKDDPMQWYTQAVNITTNIKVKVNFTLHALSGIIHVTIPRHGICRAKCV